MATRIRLQRHGKKGKPFFHIVVADQRAKRDGRFIEKLGVYNPNTNPATIDIDFERSLSWVQKGAQPSDTARAILSYKGVLMKDHLLRGVQKGALTDEQAEAKFELWLKEKESTIGAKKSNLSKSKDAERKARLAAEKEVNDARAAALAAEEAAANAVEEPAQPETEANDAVENTEAVTEAAPAEAPAVEESETEVPAAEEAVAEVPTEEPAAEEPGTETPAEGEEEKKEEA